MPCCNICIPDQVGCLQSGDTLLLNISGLVNGENYIAVVSDNQDNDYPVPFIFDGSTNQVELPVGDEENQLPPALFNKFIGDLSIEIQDGDTNECAEFDMLITTKCITLSVNGVSGAYAKKHVGIDIPVA